TTVPTASGIAAQSTPQRAAPLPYATLFRSSDPDGDGLTLTTASALPDGLTFNGSAFVGTLSFVSAGTYPITVTANDGNGGTVDASFTWTVSGTNQELGRASSRDRGNAEGDGALSVEGRGSVSDPVGGGLTLAPASALPDGLTFNGSAFVGTLSFVSAGTYPITVTANDGNGGTVDASFTWTVSGTNQDPTTSGIADQSNAEGDGPLSVDVTGSFTAPDGDGLTLTTASALPDGLTFNGSAFVGTLSFVSAGT